MQTNLNKFHSRVSGFLLALNGASREILNYANSEEILSRLRFPSLLLPHVIWVSPEHINKFASVGVKPNRGCDFFLGGDWDLNAISYNERSKHPKYVSCRELVIQNMPIEQTEEFNLIISNIEKDGSYLNRSDRNGAIEEMEKRRRFYHEIQEDGIKSQGDLGFSPWTGGIQAGVDRHGDLVKINAGNHRYAISRLLSLSLIPIQIAILHKNLLPNFSTGHAKARVDKVRTFIKELEYNNR